MTARRSALPAPAPAPGEQDMAQTLAELRVVLRPYARRLLAARCACSPIVRAGVGDLDTAAADVVAEAVATLWEQRSSWARRRDPRTWAFGVTRIQVARHTRAARARGRREIPLPETDADLPADLTHADTLDPDPGGPSPWPERIQGLWAVRAVLLDRLGAQAWDRILTVACAGAHARSRRVRALLAAAIDSAHTGHGIDIPAIAQAAGVDAACWAVGQHAAGRTLDPTRAVSDGAAVNVTRARRALALWWAAHNALLGVQITPTVLMDAGLVTDTPNPHAAATALAGWLAWAHPDQITPPTTRTVPRVQDRAPDAERRTSP
ncbi:hypothetical protein AGMMS50218_15270 [Actinomycetota bacterium]|nr:hypothetical protein AGMMS50218_15270 [Actinomycetota bacterium]